jgi:glutamyl-tRNA reductase
VVLSTCNRTEVYTLADTRGSGARGAESIFYDRAGLRESDVLPYIYTLRGEEAIAHLFGVASGLESMIVGEAEVLGQVQDALEDARHSRVVDPALLRLFTRAVRAGRRARAETDIGKNPVSVSSVAVALVKKALGDLSRCNVLVVSAGEASRLAVRALASQGVGDIVVASRSYEKAAALASEYNGRAVPLHDIQGTLRESDIVVSCSGAPHFLIPAVAVAEAMNSRPGRPMVLVDIAVPRDVDPAAAAIGNVHLYNIDALQSVSAANHRRRMQEKDKVLAIIADEVSSFSGWWRSRQAAPAIAALVGKAERMRASRVSAVLEELSVSDEDRAAVDAMTRAIVKKILHHPIQHVRNGSNGTGYARSVKELFDLDIAA